MEFRVGNIRAECPGCKGTDFMAPPSERAGPYMKYSCAGCGQSWTYARLIGQIGRETSRRKNAALTREEREMTKSVPQFLRRNS